jgi:hypothetical protein
MYVNINSFVQAFPGSAAAKSLQAFYKDSTATPLLKANINLHLMGMGLPART